MLHHYVNVDENQTSFKVFPNPAQDCLHLSMGNQRGFEYRIHNLLGQSVLSGRGEGGAATVDLSACLKGIYFVTLLQDGATHIEKIVIY